VAWICENGTSVRQPTNLLLNSRTCPDKDFFHYPVREAQSRASLVRLVGKKVDRAFFLFKEDAGEFFLFQLAGHRRYDSIIVAEEIS
jgi:hypothetical protein